MEGSMKPKIGDIEYLKGDTVPDGWYLCDGSELPRGLLSEQDFRDFMSRYGGLPDMRPAKAVVYLGIKSVSYLD